MNIAKQTWQYLKDHGAAYTLHKAWQKSHEHVFRTYDKWQKKNAPTEAELSAQRARVFSPAPYISIVVPTYNTKPVYLQELVDSVLKQTYGHFELCFMDDNSPSPETHEALKAAALRDSRIHVHYSNENHGIAGNSNLAIEKAEGEYIALLDHDDTLSPDALYHVAAAISDQGADMIYSDEDKINQSNTYAFTPHFKPDFSPDELRASNYICHLMVIKASLIHSSGLFDKAFDGSQDHELALRISELAQKIVHIPRVLYHWRQLQTSMSHQNLEKCVNAAHRAVEMQIKRLNINATVTTEDMRAHVRYHLTGDPEVSFIVTHRQDEKQLHAWLNSLKGMPKMNAKLLLVSKEPVQLTDTPFASYENIIAEKDATRYQMLNRCAKSATGDVLLFMDTSVTFVNAAELETLIGRAQLSDAGIVSPLILYKNKTIRHQGYLVGMKHVIANAQQHQPMHGWGYFCIERIAHNISAASVACFCVKRNVFNAVGGFDEGYLNDLGDVDFCLKLIERSLYNITLPDLKCIFHGGNAIVDKVPHAQDAARFLQAHGVVNDPYYNVNLTREDGSYRIRQMP